MTIGVLALHSMASELVGCGDDLRVTIKNTAGSVREDDVKRAGAVKVEIDGIDRA